MPAKDFERVLRFIERYDQNGNSISFPVIAITLITPQGNQIGLSLLFDTGASVTTLRADLYPMLGLQSWDQGERVDTDTASGRVNAYKYRATLEIFGKLIDCPIHLMQMPPNPLFHGLLGRDTIFNEFGFGFWESTHELYVTANP
jgi:hypothetical protein